MDALVIHPNSARRVYGFLADELTAIEPPIWCRIIAGYLRDKGFAATILDMEAQNLGADEVGPILERFKPRLAAIVAHGHQPSASTQTMASVPAIAQAIEGYGVPSMIVGGHASALPERTLADCGSTYVCDGEGPITIEALLNDCQEEHVPGLVWKGGRNKPARLLYPESSEMEGEAWDLLEMTRYRAHSWQAFGDVTPRTPYASIYTSFGCPFRCSFCMINAPFHANVYRMRRPERVVAEIEMLFERYGVRTFKFADEMFILKPSHYLSILRLLAERGLGDQINIWAYARVDTVKAGELELMRRAGIHWLALGIESGSEHVRDGSGKALRNDDIIGVVRRIQAAGIHVVGNFIFGLPDDDFQSMKATLDLALDARCEFANFYSAMAYPGSRLYDEAVVKGRDLPSAWSAYSQHSHDCQPLGNEILSPADVLAFRDYAFDRYFTDPDYLAMIKNRFGNPTLAHIQAMTAHKLPRRVLEAVAK